jgi:hypothetical protein
LNADCAHLCAQHSAVYRGLSKMVKKQLEQRKQLFNGGELL